MAPIIEKSFLEPNRDTFWMTKRRAKHQDIRPLKIAILNLMPNKLETEEQLFRVLSNTPLQIEIDLIRTESYQSKHTPPEILQQLLMAGRHQYAPGPVQPLELEAGGHRGVGSGKKTCP